MFGDGEGAVGLDLGDGVADVAEARDLLKESVVAAAALRAALDDVPGGERAGQRVIIVALPAELPRRRTDHQRRVGDARADDDVRASIQRRLDPPARRNRRWR